MWAQMSSPELSSDPAYSKADRSEISIILNSTPSWTLWKLRSCIISTNRSEVSRSFKSYPIYFKIDSTRLPTSNNLCTKESKFSNCLIKSILQNLSTSNGCRAASHALVLAPVAHPAAVQVSAHVAPEWCVSLSYLHKVSKTMTKTNTNTTTKTNTETQLPVLSLPVAVDRANSMAAVPLVHLLVWLWC